MKTKIFSILLLSIIISCKKEDNSPNGNNGTTTHNGTLYFQNNETDPYTIYLDGTSQGVLQAGSKSSGYSVTTGISHAVKAIQYSGYVFYPTEYTGTATLNPSGTVIWSFP